MTPQTRQALIQAMRSLQAGANGLRARLGNIHQALPYQRTKAKAERLDQQARAISGAIDELDRHADDHPSRWEFCRRCSGRKAKQENKA